MLPVIHATPANASSRLATVQAPTLLVDSNPYVSPCVANLASSYSSVLSRHQEEVPQFLVFTADDAIQSYTLDSVNQFLAHRKNPNGCPIKMTYYTSLNFTNYTLVTDWYVAGNEIADHTYVFRFLHVKLTPRLNCSSQA